MSDSPGTPAPDAATGAGEATTPAPGAQEAPGAAGTATTGGRTPDPLRGSRTSGLWIGVILLAVVFVLLAIFILQNTQSVTIAFLGLDGQAPLAAMLLIAAAAGALLVVIAGSLRILQLRRRVRRARKA